MGSRTDCSKDCAASQLRKNGGASLVHIHGLQHQQAASCHETMSCTVNSAHAGYARPCFSYRLPDLPRLRCPASSRRWTLTGDTVVSIAAVALGAPFHSTPLTRRRHPVESLVIISRVQSRKKKWSVLFLRASQLHMLVMHVAIGVNCVHPPTKFLRVCRTGSLLIGCSFFRRYK